MTLITAVVCNYSRSQTVVHNNGSYVVLCVILQHSAYYIKYEALLGVWGLCYHLITFFTDGNS